MGFGYWAPSFAPVPFTDLWALPGWTGDESTPVLAQEWHLSGLSAPEPIEIPWLWLAPPFRLRQDKAVTHASVTRSAGGTAISSTPAAEEVDFTASLDTADEVTAANLAHFMTTYYDEPRSRIAQLRFILGPLNRTQDEQWQILGVKVGDRVRITGTPAGWPDGAESLVVEGIAHQLTTETRIVTWSTSPVIGEVPGSVGPFFRVGVSTLGGPDLLPW